MSDAACWCKKFLAGARLYAGARPSVITWGLGIDVQGINAMQAVRARRILRAVTGNLDVPGGEILGVFRGEPEAVSNLEIELIDTLEFR